MQQKSKRTPSGYLPSSRISVTAAKGKEKKQMINITDVIGTNADIERRIQEQLERPKAMFSDDDRVGEILNRLLTP
jgi:antiviral helicase SLH1